MTEPWGSVAGAAWPVYVRNAARRRRFLDSDSVIAGAGFEPATFGL